MAQKRFKIRNYGPTRQINIKGQMVTVTKDRVIETDDADFAKEMGKQEMIHVTENTGEVPNISRADKVRQELADKDKKQKEKEQKDKGDQKPPDNDTKPSDEIKYSDMKVSELKVLLQDRQLPVKGNKPEMIKALEAYDATQEANEDNSEESEDE